MLPFLSIENTKNRKNAGTTQQSWAQLEIVCTNAYIKNKELLCGR